MEAGLGNDGSTWDPVVPAVSALARVCVYDRAGLGGSDPAPTPRTAQDAVDDLKALVVAARISEPIVLVGHSFGGMVVRLYAMEHPASVAGLVIVDGTPAPDFEMAACKHVEKAACARVKADLASENGEGIDFVASEAELGTAPALLPMSLVVIVATQHDCDTTEFTLADCAALDAVVRSLDETLVNSVPGGQLLRSDSGHYVQAENPQIVINAITSVVTAARAN